MKKKAVIELPKDAKKILVEDTQPVRAHDVGQEFYGLYDEAINKAIDSGIRETPGDFYVLGLVFKDPMDKKQEQIQIRARYCMTCPTPTWCQYVYKYRRTVGHLDLLWCVPPLSVCNYYEYNKHLIPPEEYCLLQYILQFHSGELDKICAKENKEIA